MTDHDPAPGIDELYAAWYDAFRHRDLDAVLALLTSDYVLWPSGADPLTRDALAPRLRFAMDTYDITPSFECEERIVSGDLAFERGWDVQHVRPRAGGDARTQRQHVFLVLRRGDDGRWRFARGVSHAIPNA